MRAGTGNKSGVWSPEEDDLLAKGQADYGNKWSEVARHIPGKTGQQCAQRWRHRVNPDIRREKWGAQEDAALAALVEQYGNAWAVIARNMPGRTDQQCMGRWRRHLDPTIRRDNWTQDEDELLFDLAEQFDNAWSQVSKRIKGRTPQQCRTRWHYISENPHASLATLPHLQQPAAADPAFTTALGYNNFAVGGKKRRGRPSKASLAAAAAAAAAGGGAPPHVPTPEAPAGSDAPAVGTKRAPTGRRPGRPSNRKACPVEYVPPIEDEFEYYKEVEEGGAPSFYQRDGHGVSARGYSSHDEDMTEDEDDADNFYFEGDEDSRDEEYVPGRKKRRRRGHAINHTSTRRDGARAGGEGVEAAATTLNAAQSRRARENALNGQNLRKMAPKAGRSSDPRAVHVLKEQRKGAAVSAGAQQAQHADRGYANEAGEQVSFARFKLPSSSEREAAEAAEHSKQDHDGSGARRSAGRTAGSLPQQITNADAAMREAPFHSPAVGKKRSAPTAAAAGFSPKRSRDRHLQQRDRAPESMEDRDTTIDSYMSLMDPPLLMESSRAERRVSLGDAPLSPALFSPALTPPWTRKKRPHPARLAAFGPSQPAGNTTPRRLPANASPGLPQAPAPAGSSFFLSPRRGPGDFPSPGLQGTPPLARRNGSDDLSPGGAHAMPAMHPSPGILDLLKSPQHAQQQHHLMMQMASSPQLRPVGDYDNDSRFPPSPLSPQFKGLVTPEWARAAAAASAAAEQDAHARRLSIASVARRLDVDSVAAVLAAAVACHSAEGPCSVIAGGSGTGAAPGAEGRRESLVTVAGTEGGNTTDPGLSTRFTLQETTTASRQQHQSHVLTAIPEFADPQLQHRQHHYQTGGNESPLGGDSLNMSLSISAGGIPPIITNTTGPAAGGAACFSPQDTTPASVPLLYPNAMAGTPTGAAAATVGTVFSAGNGVSVSATGNLLVPESAMTAPQSHGRSFLAATLQRTLGTGYTPPVEAVHMFPTLSQYNGITHPNTSTEAGENTTNSTIAIGTGTGSGPAAVGGPMEAMAKGVGPLVGLTGAMAPPQAPAAPVARNTVQPAALLLSSSDVRMSLHALLEKF